MTFYNESIHVEDGAFLGRSWIHESPAATTASVPPVLPSRHGLDQAAESVHGQSYPVHNMGSIPSQYPNSLSADYFYKRTYSNTTVPQNLIT